MTEFWEQKTTENAGTECARQYSILYFHSTILSTKPKGPKPGLKQGLEIVLHQEKFLPRFILHTLLPKCYSGYKREMIHLIGKDMEAVHSINAYRTMMIQDKSLQGAPGRFAHQRPY